MTFHTKNLTLNRRLTPNRKKEGMEKYYTCDYFAFTVSKHFVLYNRIFPHLERHLILKVVSPL